MSHKGFDIAVFRKSQPPGYLFETTGYEQAQLICVTRGTLSLTVHGWDSDMACEPGSYVLLRAGGGFALRCRGEGYRGVGVVLNGTLPEPFRGDPLCGILDTRLRCLEMTLLRHMEAPLPESAEVLQGVGIAFVWEVLALSRERTAASRDWAVAARTALDLTIGTGTSVRQALACLPLSYRQLCRCFRERFGTSPKQYQALLRVDEARRMLSATQLDMTSIASELGYCSSQHFATQFRRLVGCSPSTYRAGRRDSFAVPTGHSLC